MPRTFGEDRPIEGEPLDETCPKCGGEVVSKETPKRFGKPAGHKVRCRECEWDEERPEAD